MLDIMIRDASDNKQSLDDVHARPSIRARTNADADSRRRTGGTRCAPRRTESRSRRSTRRYIDGREPFPWDSILPTRRTPRAPGANVRG